MEERARKGEYLLVYSIVAGPDSNAIHAGHFSDVIYVSWKTKTN